MGKRKKHNIMEEGYTLDDCKCEYCIYKGRRKNGHTTCLAETCVCQDEIMEALGVVERG